jgi:chromosomal replication initiator protein
MQVNHQVSHRFISIAEIQHAVAAAFSLTRSDLLSRSRERQIACARHVAMYLSREMARGGGWPDSARRETPRTSYPRIGMAFGRDHTSVMHACNSVESRCKSDSRFARMVTEIAEELRERVERMSARVAA